MSKCNHDRYHRKLNPPGPLKPAKIVFSKLQVRGYWRWRDLCRSSRQYRQGAPYKKHDNHNRGDLHDAKRLRTRFVNAFNIAPPEVRGRHDAECRRELIGWNRHARMQHFGYFVDDPAEILAGADGADWTR